MSSQPSCHVSAWLFAVLPCKTGHLEPEFVDRRLEPFEEAAVVPLVPKYLLPPIATSYGMVDRAGKLNTQWTSHPGSLSQHTSHGNTLCEKTRKTGLTPRMADPENGPRSDPENGPPRLATTFLFSRLATMRVFRWIAQRLSPSNRRHIGIRSLRNGPSRAIPTASSSLGCRAAARRQHTSLNFRHQNRSLLE